MTNCAKILVSSAPTRKPKFQYLQFFRDTCLLLNALVKAEDSNSFVKFFMTFSVPTIRQHLVAFTYQNSKFLFFPLNPNNIYISCIGQYMKHQITLMFDKTYVLRNGIIGLSSTRF